MPTNYREEIEYLEALLNSGLSGVSIAGHSNRYDIDQIRKRIAELRTRDPDSVSAGLVKPRSIRIKMSNAW